MKKILLTMLLILSLLPVSGAYAVSRTPYNWHNLPLGGQGFITGLIIHPTEENLVYVRTDVGGCYRWNEETHTWKQLCDQFPHGNSHMGIDGMAIDPQDPDVVYIATGGAIYNKGEVLKSTDRGETWVETGFNKRFASNAAYRDCGECIQVDPVNSKIVYVVTRKEGLYRSTNGASTWDRVSSLEYPLDESKPARVVKFDPASAKDGKTQTIYVSVLGYGLYVTYDAGETWSQMETPFNSAVRMSIYNSIVYCATEKGAFKYDGSKWTEISPSHIMGKRMYSINVDQSNGDRIVLVDSGSVIYMSSDGGKTWANKITSGTYQSTLPWTDENYGYSANNHDTQFDATNPKRVWSTDWFGVYKTEDIDQQPMQVWRTAVAGIEETVPRDAICPPTGKYRLITAVADVDGFVYEDIYSYPKRFIREERDKPWMMGSTQLDFCEEDPNIILRPGVDWNSIGKLEYSTDNTESWNNITNIPHYVDAKGNPTTAIQFGRAAVGAQLHPETGCAPFVIVPAYNVTETQRLPEGMDTVPLVSIDHGKTWTQSKGFPAGFNSLKGYWDTYTTLASDRVNGKKFYMCSQNMVFVSEDYGYNWEQTARIEGNWYETVIRTAPGMEGEVWIGMGDWGLFRSSDSARTFTKIEAVGNCQAVGFGKGAPGYDNPATYVLGTIDGMFGAFRSDDMGETWVKLNDDKTTLNQADMVIVGDRQTYGVVYVGSAGRSFYVGVPKGVDLNAEKEVAEEDNNAVYTVYYDGVKVKFLNIPIVKDGTILVPVRDLLDYYKFDMAWDNDTQSLSAIRKELDVQNMGMYFRGEKQVASAKFTMGSSIATVNGKEKPMSSPAVRINERMYIPVSSIVDVLGNQIEIDTENKVVNVYDNNFILSE